MNRTQLLDLHEAMCDKARDLMKAKNHDYTDGADGTDPFSNFRAAEELGICEAKLGLIIRMVDKVKRLITFAKKGTLLVVGESYEDAILDIINYSVLLAGMVCEDQTEAGQPRSFPPKKGIDIGPSLHLADELSAR